MLITSGVCQFKFCPLSIAKTCPVIDIFFIKKSTALHICSTSTCLFKGVARYCFLKCFSDCLWFLIVGPGAPGPTIKNQRQSEKHFRKQYLATPLKRQVDVEQICNAVDFFIKNISITGQVLAIDSGQNLNWQTPDVMSKEWKKIIWKL